jgi:ABC-type transport system involved in multi-copper enzyme maturation permease subunit
MRGVADDLLHFSPARLWTVARLATSEALRLRVLGLVLLGVAAVILADLSTRRFDPVFDTIPSLIHLGEIVITVVGLALAIFLSTYSLPRELASKTIFGLVTKPVSRLEIVGGKMAALVVVLFIITFSLGALSWGYFEIRARQIQSLASSQWKLQQDNDNLPELLRREKSHRLPTDINTTALERIATFGPLQAAVYQTPSTPLTVVSLPSSTSTEWLTGYPGHRANWGFEDLPVDDFAAGKVHVVFQVDFPEVAIEPKTNGPSYKGLIPPLPPPESARRVEVRLHDDLSNTNWSDTFTLSPDGELDLTIPPTGPDSHFIYSGGRLWITLCGAGNAPDAPRLGVRDDSCTIQAGGRSFTSLSGLRLVSNFTMNKYWVGGGGEGSLLLARTRFPGLSPARLGPAAAVQVETAVPNSADIPPDARVWITVINESSGQSKTATFRPERGAAALVPLDRDFCAGGPLAVYVYSKSPAVEIGVAADSIRLRTGDQPFVANWAKDLAMIWLAACVISAIGVCISTVAGWQVASLMTAVLLLVANIWLPIIHSVERYGVLQSLHLGTATSRQLAEAYKTLFGFLGLLLPDMAKLDYGNQIASGVAAPLSALTGLPAGGLWHVALYSLAMVLLGYLFFRIREVAR